MSVQVSLKKYILAAVLIFQFVTSISAQKTGSDYRWEVGFSGGASMFLNSINPNSDAEYKKFNYWNSDLNSSFSLSLLKKITSQFSAEFEWQTTKLSGTWNENNGYPVPQRAVELDLPFPGPFKTGIHEFDLMISVNLNKIISPKIKNEKWSVFIKGGGGAVLLKGYQSLFPYSTSGNPFKYAIAYGAGLNYTIADKIKLKLGITIHQVETDRLDGVHSTRTVSPYDAYFKVKEVYSTIYIGIVYGLFEYKIGNPQGKVDPYPWFQPSSRKYKGRK
jgi:hypothetical protein